MADQAYEIRERLEFNRALREPDKNSLAERKEAVVEFHEAMKHRPHVVGERVGWLLEGHYGYGAMKAAEEVVANKRMNRFAWVTQVVGALEWQSPTKASASAWKKLTAGEKHALDAAVKKAIKEHLEGR